MSNRINLHAPAGVFTGEIDLPGSKSVSNRVLIVRALCGGDFAIRNLSDADDTQRLLYCLNNPEEDEYCGDGGTTFRFLMALRACQGKTGTLTAEGRMLDRPIAPLLDALNALGADIRYTQGQGRAAVQFSGQQVKGGEIRIPANISSQFLSALMLIGPYLPGGLKIIPERKTVSGTYIDMTAALMKEFGVNVVQEGNIIGVPEGRYVEKSFSIPADWSAAAVFYALVALRPGSKLLIRELAHDRYQGDRALAGLMHEWGVHSVEVGHDISITSSGIPKDFIEADFSNTPDLAQVFTVMAAVANRPIRLTGLSTLRIKETDRIAALVAELEKAGATVQVESDSLQLISGIKPESVSGILFDTHGDHRMVMALALIGACGLPVMMRNPTSVTKSFPGFFNQLGALGFYSKVDSLSD